MDPAAIEEQFATELMQGIGSFLGLPVNATTSLLTELLYAIEAQVRIMEQLNSHPESRMMADALDNMQTVCEKMPKARILRSYVGRLAGTQDKAVRKKLLTELLELVTSVKRRQKRF
jgi:hypothetical protein